MVADLTTVNGVPLPPGTYFFNRVTETDHSGWIWVVALLSLIYPLGSLFVRLQVRWGLYGVDDWTLLAATIVSIAQHVPVFVALRRGLGKSSSVLQGEQISRIDEGLFAAEVLFILAHTASKTSLAMFVRRLFTNSRKQNTVLCWLLLGLNAGWGIVTILVLFVACSPYHYLSLLGACSSNVVRWQIVTILDVITELATIAVPSYLVSTVMLGSGPKLLVISAFAFRLPLIAISIMHLTRLSEAPNANDTGFGYVYPIIWIQIWLGFSLISASIPSFKAFMRPLDDISVSTTNGSHSASRSELNGAYLMMGPVKSNHSRNANSARSGSAGPSMGSMRLDKVGTRVSVQHGRINRRSAGENNLAEGWNSQENIIRRDVEWEIRHESGTF